MATPESISPQSATLHARLIPSHAKRYPRSLTAEILKLRAKKTDMTLAEMERKLQVPLGTIAYRLRAAGQPYAPAQVTNAQLEEFQVYADPGYEARNYITHQVVCRKCGRLLNRILSGHLRTHGMTAADYRHKYPGCLRAAYDAMLRSTPAKVRPTLEEYVAAGAAKYLTPPEMVIHLNDCLYEIKDKTDYAACRLCGLKCSYALGSHTRRVHRCTQRQYHHQFPGAAWTAPKFQEAKSQRARSFWRRMGSRPKGWKHMEPDKQAIWLIMNEYPEAKGLALGALLDGASIHCPFGDGIWAHVLRNEKADGYSAAKMHISRIRKLK